MSRSLSLCVVSVVLVGVGVGLGAGCGDLSQEDLLFRAAIPSQQAVAVTPPGSDDDDGATNSQALTAACDAGDLRCDAATIARTLNRLTFGLLALVDHIAAAPPTTRSPGRRVWGPLFDAERGTTFRFEMQRGADDVTFTFCLHGAAGRHDDVADVADLDCEQPARGAFLRVLHGAFAPDGLSDASAKNGAGTMHLDVAALASIGAADAGSGFARALDFAFDNRDDATSIHIDVQGARVNDVDRDAGYDFERDATGAGDFALVIFKDVVDGARARSALERVRLLARWQVGGAGRAEGIVDDGDATTPLLVSQCWDASLATTFSRAVDGDAGGDEARCVFGAAEVLPPE